MGRNPYDLSDQAIDLLNRKAIHRFREAQRQTALLDFDELSVIQICKDLYESLASDNKKAFLDLAIMAYNQANKRRKADEEEEELFEFWLMDQVLGRPNDVTHYTYTHEVERKRDRLAEAVNSVSKFGAEKITVKKPEKTAKRSKAKKATTKAMEFQRGLRLWAGMTKEYCDIVTAEATLKAFKDSGVKRVRWRTEDDDKVCPTCGPRDKKVYDIDKVPPKPHPNCRCWLEAVKG